MGYAKSLIDDEGYGECECGGTFDDNGSCELCGNYYENFSIPESTMQPRSIGKGIFLHENMVSQMKEDFNIYLTNKELREKKWRPYQTVIVKQKIDVSKTKPWYDKVRNPDLSDELDLLDKVSRKKLESILATVKGLPDIIAFKEGKVGFIECKGIHPTYRDLSQVQEERKKEIVSAGFLYAIHRKGIEIKVNCVGVEMEGDEF